ncbi:unnamed protein product [Pleuronectes platessa]|uniref:Uncharacterized protein n=1 Tax=Pleuronectes platessa TaxID=8262 RepID=A0A9N7U0X4_PLEPL|nr:unnamed protein product [Pleuronectes platessa]
MCKRPQTSLGFPPKLSDGSSNQRSVRPAQIKSDSSSISAETESWTHALPPQWRQLNDQPPQECTEPLALKRQRLESQRWLRTLSGGIVHNHLTLGKLKEHSALAVDWPKIELASSCLPRPATCRQKVLPISKAGYLLWIQMSPGFQFIWPQGTSVPLFELNPKSHQGLI